jgi:phosphoglycolate phosphatase
MPKVVLFDIDGTLVLTGRAGVRAMNRAGQSVLGVPDLLDDIQIAGRTDWSILRDATAKYGRALDRELLAQLRAAYVSCLREEIEHPGEGVKAVMPGIPDLLPALHGRDDVLLGLLTGNFVDGARIKLEHFDLWRYFAWGAFGDDAEDRNALVPFALERARAQGVCEVPYGDVFVIGDTPHDVACALAVGAVPIAVATGNYTVDELRGTGAAIVLRDLGDTGAVLDLLAG